jgi:pimeloyl-ACP methyl ester carboxylesterase
MLELSLKEKENLNLVISELDNININLAYCFPSLGDHFGEMRSLAEKLSFPIIALNWTESYNSFSSMEEITNKWVEVILEDSNANEDDGFNLIGYSFGGIAAFETAIKLQKQNKKIKNLIIFDSTPVNEFLDQLFFDYGKMFDIADKSSESLEIIIKFVTGYIPIDYIAFKNQLLNSENDEKKIEVSQLSFIF